MKRADIEAFLARDWARMARLKLDHWKRLGPAGALRAAEDLRDQARIACPGWPTRKDREEDLEVHRRVSQALRRTPPLDR